MYIRERILRVVMDKRYRVVLDSGLGREGSLATSPIEDRDQALEEFDAAVRVFGKAIVAGEMRVRVLDEEVWAGRRRTSEERE